MGMSNSVQDLSIKKTTNIKIPDQLYNLLVERVPETGATSVDELASRVIEEWAKRRTPLSQRRVRLGAKDEKIVMDRLRALGYV